VKNTMDKNALRRALADMRMPAGDRAGAFGSGIAGLDGLAPNGGFARGAVHELLWPRGGDGSDGEPMSLAMMLAAAAQREGQGGRGAVAWNDPERELYLPGLAAGGIDLRNLVLLRCDKRGDQLWALAECLRCRGVSATVARVENLTQLEARRLQLAAERGGGVGVFMRPYLNGIGAYYAAATRWLIQRAPGSRQVQRWSVQLLHGHGGQIGKVLLLEVDRETRALRVSAPLADRPAAPASARASA
jgi:protein ImuA